MNKFIMMIGLPASGKSTYAKKLAEQYNATIFSSDKLREEMFGDVNCQDNNQELFAELHKRIKECLKNGKSAIYDATNISYKRRMAFLSELKNISCEKTCVLMATPFEECLVRNYMREREVPSDVIIRMYKNFDIPYWYEGWDFMRVEYGDLFGYYGSAKTYIERYSNYDQHNSHHTLTLGEHCKKTAMLLDERASSTVFYAAYIHDCGKPDVAAYKNNKGEATDELHYYNHQNVGAYKSLFYRWESVSPLDIAVLVRWHMQPYFNKEEKTKEKYRKLWGENLYKDIMFLHEADKHAH